MTRAVLLLVLAAGCASQRDRVPERVPRSYHDVAASLGHTAHVGKMPCADCHGPTGFEVPPAELCSKCHANVITPLHPGMHAPQCQDCHAFGAKPVARDDCLRCHDKPQYGNPAIGAHREVACNECHDPHRTQQKVDCARCHDDRQTHHAGARGCRDCHSIHEDRKVVDAQCQSCHQ